MVGSVFPNERLRDLTPQRQAFLRLMQRVGFGSITFEVRRGAPDLARPHHVARTLKLAGTDRGPQPETGVADFELRHEHVALLGQLAMLPDGSRVKVKVTHGLPGSSIDLEEDHQAA